MVPAARLAALVVLLACAGEAVADVAVDHPSELWSPYPSSTWSPPRPSSPWTPYPSSAWSPRVAMVETNPETESEQPLLIAAGDFGLFAEFSPAPVAMGDVCFDAPPLGEEFGPSTHAYAGAPPNYVGQPRPDAWHVQSHFLPSLGRFGLVAPRTPGVDSVHSPFVAAPPWAAPPWDKPVFGPPAYVGPQYDDHCPPADHHAHHGPYSSNDFSPDPFYDHIPYDACAEQDIYGGKHLNPTQRPLIEWGFPFYDTGPVPPPSTRFGETNPSLPRFYVYGDYRAAAAYNKQNGNDLGVLAHRLNLEWDLWLTSTERIHMFTGPLQDGGNFQRFEFDDGSAEFFDEVRFFDAETDTLFFEGDLGYIVGGLTGTYAPFDAPIAAGLIPLLFQNGVWMEDAILGTAMTIPARNSPRLDWSNFDVTFFFGTDRVTSPAFESDRAANVFGATTFIEAKGGYLEAGYAFLDDSWDSSRSYHNVGISYTRRYLNLMSNSVRVIVNAGQDGPQSARTADGFLLLVENSFLTPAPYNVIPYVNLFVGFDRPQSVARAGAAGGVLRNTGILFESDNLTGFPTLDATANDTYGAAVGLNLLAPEFTHQLIVEAAVLQTFGDSATRNAPGDQCGLGLRYQVPITNAHLLRFDVMHGWLGNTDDVSGARAEFRWKF